MSKLLSAIYFVFVLLTFSVQAQSQAVIQGTYLNQDQDIIKSKHNTLIAYTKWRDESLRNYALGALSPHYAVAIVAQRLDDSTAQVEVLIAAEMKQYTVTIKPVTLNRLASGEAESKSAGNAVTIDQKAGDKLGTGSDKIRIGQMTTKVAISKAVQALEITWTPKNDNKEGFANTCIVRLSKEPEVVVNGYILGEPVR